MEQSDILGSLKGGLGLAGKLAGKGLGEVSGMFKGSEDGGSSLLSGLYWNRGNWDTKELLPYPDFFEPHAKSAFSVGMVKRLTLSKAERLFLQACRDLTTAGKGAAEALRDAVAKDPQFTDGYFLLGCVSLTEGDNAQAVQAFQKAMLCQQGLGNKLKKYLPSFRMNLRLTPNSVFSLYPDLLGLNILLALAHCRAGNLNDAVSSMEQLLGVMPANPTALFFIGALLLLKGDNNKILDLLKDILPDSSVHAACLLVLGKACSNMGDSATANELYRNAMDRSEIDPALITDLKYAVEQSAGYWGNERSDYSAVLMEFPDYKPFFERLGLETSKSGVTLRNLESAAAQPPAKAYGSVPAPSAVPAPAVPAPSAVPAPAASVSAPSAVPAPAASVSAPSAVPAPAASVPAPSAVPAPAASVPAPSAVPAPAASVPAPSVVPAPAASAPAPAVAVPAPSAVPAPPEPPAPAASASAAAAPLWCLRLVCKELGIDVALSERMLIIGREEGDILLSQDSSVSRMHARIIFENGTWMLEDMRSTNGTWVNGYRMSSRRLEIHRGDSIIFGKTLFSVQ